MPGHIRAGICNDLISNIDFLPTLASLTGAAQPKLKIDGIDFIPYLTGKDKEPPRKYLCFYFQRNSLEAVTDGRFKLVFPHYYQSYEMYEPGKDGAPGRIGYRIIESPEMYDLRQDPGERCNVIGVFPEKETELLRVADEIRADLGDDLTGIEGTGRRKPGKK